MPLDRYKAKRDFKKTPEPGPDDGKARKGKARAKGKRAVSTKAKSKSKSASKAAKPIFVVQEHHASRLHYDFRLEADGVLKSWAVPKGPSLDPSDKRLAVQVEDHPLAYATFKGKIPEGQYGAGTVKIWDHGTFDNVMADKPEPLSLTESIDAGHVEVDLHGKRLRGRFALVRMQGPSRGKVNWLLIKMKDEHAQAENAEASENQSDGAGSRSKAPSRTGARASSAKSEKSDAKPAGKASRARKETSNSEAPSGDGSKPTKASRTRGDSKRKSSARAAPAGAPRQFTAFTHTDKVLFPEAGITKGDVIDYYDRVADRLLPYLRDRPATLERLPDGLSGPHAPHFWQKDLPESTPEWVPRIALETEQGKVVHYALVNDRATLLYLVNQGTLTFHVWFSRVEDLDRPDFVLFDLDPGRASFADAVEVARLLHECLEADGHEALIKTSGKNGLHVLVPWTQPGGYDASRAWARAVAESVASAHPKLATVEIRKAARGARVYIDVMQNARGHHAVPPYVLRPTPEATVSTPLTWRELDADLDPHSFTLKTLFRRLSRQKADPLGKHLLPA